MNNDDFTTTDIGLAAYLCTQGFPLLAVEPEGRRSWFVFSKEVRQEVEKFWDGKCLVEPALLLSKVRDLKSRTLHINT